MSLFDRMLVRALPLVPRPIVERVASRYIAGPGLADACRVVSALNREGKLATLDVLGEEVTRREEADELARAYLGVFDAIERERLGANVSVKPTALGLELGREVFRANLETVAREAGRRGIFVRVDMEASPTTDATLETYRELRSAGLDNVGVVLQAALRRTAADARALAPLRPSVRVCKGIYVEPEELAHAGAEEIRASFLETVEILLDGGARVALATHDEPLLERCLRLVRERGLGPDRYELQFLLGVKPGVASRLVREGHPLRVYVPFGPRWYEYSLRRLRENPRLATQIALSLFRRPGRRR